MGVDITLAVERRRAGRWERAEPLVPADEVDAWGPQPGTRRARLPVYEGRNRELYRVLAFGHRLEWPPRSTPPVFLEPIAPPRGLPADATAETRTHFEESGGRDASWLLLNEILAYDWSQGVVEVARWKLSDVGERAAAERPAPPRPPLVVRTGRWAGRLILRGLSRPGLRIGVFDPSHGAGSVPPPAPTLGLGWRPYEDSYPDTYGDPVQTYVLKTGQTYRDAAGNFWDETVPALRALGSADDVRVVFWFW